MGAWGGRPVCSGDVYLEPRGRATALSLSYLQSCVEFQSFVHLHTHKVPGNSGAYTRFSYLIRFYVTSIEPLTMHIRVPKVVDVVGTCYDGKGGACGRLSLYGGLGTPHTKRGAGEGDFDSTQVRMVEDKCEAEPRAQLGWMVEGGREHTFMKSAKVESNGEQAERQRESAAQ